MNTKQWLSLRDVPMPNLLLGVGACLFVACLAGEILKASLIPQTILWGVATAGGLLLSAWFPKWVARDRFTLWNGCQLALCVIYVGDRLWRII